jgi:hypothetical protein
LPADRAEPWRLVDLDGEPDPIYAEWSQIGSDFERAGPALRDTTVESSVAILYSYLSRWTIDWQKMNPKYDANVYCQLPGSVVNGASIDDGPDALTAHSFNSNVLGCYDFQVRNGEVVGVAPKPMSFGFIGAGILVLGLFRRKLHRQKVS